MLAGHFGVSYTLKAKENHASLGLLFLAVGFADLLWSLFILLGREQAQLAPNLPSSRLNLSYMPIDHSLVGILFWSIVIYVLFRFLPVPQGVRKSAIALVMAVAVFSHFVLDIPVHRGDLGLIGNMYKIGFGLYNYPLPAFLLEAACLLGGLWLYLRSTTGTTFLGKYGMILLALLLLLINAFSYWGPNPQNIQEIALFLPAVYLVSALLADWLDGKRIPKAVSVPESVQPATEVSPLLWSSERLGYTIPEGEPESCRKSKRPIRRSLSVKLCDWHRAAANRSPKSLVS